jgi:hypothetical protein
MLEKSEHIDIIDKYCGEIFHSGQRIICINNEKIKFSLDNNIVWNDSGEELLELNKIYVVDMMNYNSGRAKVVIKIDYWGGGDSKDWFYPDRFHSLGYYRVKKLERISNGIN